MKRKSLKKNKILLSNSSCLGSHDAEMKGYLMNSHMNQRVPLFDHPVRMSFMFELNTRK